METELLQQLKMGEEKAYHSVFNSYFSVLVAFANKYLHDLDLSKEVVQNDFVKLYEKRHSLTISTSLKSYLYKMVYNDCLNTIKSRKIAEGHYSIYAKEMDEKEDFEKVFEQTEKEQKIFNAISQLPPQCRTILEQSRFEGKKNREIAEELNISIRTVETQISKALRLIKAGINMLF